MNLEPAVPDPVKVHLELMMDVTTVAAPRDF